MNHAPRSIRFCIEELGADRVLFAADHPFENGEREVEGIRAAELSPQEWELVAHGNAERIFGL
jgi:predicted TIM-barrel fold metal-dependent hydrolase